MNTHHQTPSSPAKVKPALAALIAAATIVAMLFALATPTQSAANSGGGTLGAIPGNNNNGGKFKKAKLVREVYKTKKGKKKVRIYAVAPASAPKAVKRAIAAANRIDKKKYVYGGGHKSNTKIDKRGYDCSGTVSYVLGPKGANIMSSPMPSGPMMKWGKKGKGKWITVYAHGGHAFVEIAGLRFDTSMPDDGQSGPGWSADVKKGLRNGKFKKRKPADKNL